MPGREGAAGHRYRGMKELMFRQLPKEVRGAGEDVVGDSLRVLGQELGVLAHAAQH